MNITRTKCVLLVLFLCGPLVLPTAMATPPPRPVCGVCSDGFVTAGTVHNVSVTVTNSTAVVRVHGNGSAIWTVTNRIEGDTERLHNDSRLLERIARDAARTPPISATITGDTVRIRYRTDGFAVRSIGGAMGSSYFTAQEYRNYAELGADRLAVVAPEGMEMGMTLSGATVSGDRMTITSYDDRRAGPITFVPKGSPVGPLLSVLAVLAMVGPIVVRNAVVFLGPSIAMVALITWGAMRSFSRTEAVLSGVVERGSMFCAVGGLLLIGSLVADGMTGSLIDGAYRLVIGGGALFVYGIVLIILPWSKSWTTYWRLVGCVLVIAIPAVAGVLVFPRRSLSLLVLLVAVFGFVPAGDALGRGDTRTALLTAVSGFFPAMIALPPLYTPSLGKSLLLVPLYIGVVSVVAVFGLPLLVAGSSLTEQSP